MNEQTMTKNKEARTANRRLAQWRVTWLIEHFTSHQLLWRKSPPSPSRKTLCPMLGRPNNQQQTDRKN